MHAKDQRGASRDVSDRSRLVSSAETPGSSLGKLPETGDRIDKLENR